MGYLPCLSLGLLAEGKWRARRKNQSDPRGGGRWGPALMELEQNPVWVEAEAGEEKVGVGNGAWVKDGSGRAFRHGFDSSRGGF